MIDNDKPALSSIIATGNPLSDVPGLMEKILAPFTALAEYFDSTKKMAAHNCVSNAAATQNTLCLDILIHQAKEAGMSEDKLAELYSSYVTGLAQTMGQCLARYTPGKAALMEVLEDLFKISREIAREEHDLRQHGGSGVTLN